MAQYAAELYRDDEAIEYAAKAVELSPDDAQGHYRLGTMYRRRQDSERAMAEFRKAIAKNDRLFVAYFDLAEMLISTSNKVDEADRLYRRVVRASRDEEFVVRAARLSMQINLGRGSLESLERELLPVALGNPQKPVYRRLLVELYGTMAFPLVLEARLGGDQKAKDAKAQLTAIGTRAVKPLLDGLTDERIDQQRIAIEVLAYVQNKGAGPALFNFATGRADRALRVRAMVAASALADPELIGRYEKLLMPDDGSGVAPGDAVAVAAVWGVARMRSPKAEALLARLLTSSSPDARALSAIGLGLGGNARHAEALSALAQSPEAGPTARAAAAHALGELGHVGARPLLLALTDAAEPQVKMAALLALSRLERKTPSDEVGAILARALFGEDAELRRVAVAAATALVSGEYRRKDTLPVPDGLVVADDVLATLAPSGYSAAEEARALASLRQPLTKAALAAVATSPERARVVAELVATDLTALVDDPAALSAEARAELAQAAEAIAVATVDGFVALARHPSIEVRKRAVAFLAGRTEPQARRAVVDALDPSDPEICKTALGHLGATDHDMAVAAVVALATDAPSWSLRAHAAQALASMGTSDGQRAQVEKALSRAATADDYALVREAAVRSVARRGPDFSRPLLERIAQNDAEPRVRELARSLVND